MVSTRRYRVLYIVTIIKYDKWNGSWLLVTKFYPVKNPTLLLSPTSYPLSIFIYYVNILVSLIIRKKSEEYVHWIIFTLLLIFLVTKSMCVWQKCGYGIQFCYHRNVGELFYLLHSTHTQDLPEPVTDFSDKKWIRRLLVRRFSLGRLNSFFELWILKK